MGYEIVFHPKARDDFAIGLYIEDDKSIRIMKIKYRKESYR
jgi:hypothetical protein